VYNDSFAKDAEISNLESGLTDEEGNRLLAKDPMQANPETAGRYHSDWLTMMYPRLKLARNLLTDDGVIFISIDDNEVHNLRKICDEVFGEVNFLVNIVWEKRFTRSNNSKTFTTLTENVLCYRKSEILDEIKEPRNEKSDSIYSNPDGDPRGIWTSVSIVNPATKEQRPNLSYVIKNPHSGEEIEHPTNAWKVERKRYEIYENENRLYWGRSGENKYPRLKKFLSDMEGGMVPVDLWSHKDTGTTDQGSKELENLFERKLFDFPKPPSLIKRMLNIATQPDSIILDFFSGSSTTAHAVMQLNAEDGGKRKFIMVQLPEKIDEKSEAYKAGYQNICEIGKERIRRAGAKLTSSDSSKGVDNTLQFEEAAEKKPVDTGFRVYRLDTSNMQDVYYRPQDYKQEMMNELFANHIKTDRTADDLVAQVMLDWGLPLSLTIEQTKIAGKTVYKVDGNALYCCFDDNIDESFARSVAPNAPMRIVFHDHSFANDTAKENVRQLLKQLSRDTEMKVV
jgi:adenine-specific DNA-methyltransferase